MKKMKFYVKKIKTSQNGSVTKNKRKRNKVNGPSENICKKRETT
jgi:hypothetical protein